MWKLKTKSMDHLPPLLEPSTFQRDVPLLCGIQDYDSKEFSSFPDRCGWVVSEDRSGNIILLKDNLPGDESNAVISFVQAWLFFGTIVEVFSSSKIRIVLEDFVQRKDDGQFVITTAQLPSYIDQLNHPGIWFGNAGNYARVRILSCFRIGSDFIQNENVLRPKLGQYTTVDSLILSIQILGETLEYALYAIWTSLGILDAVPTNRIWSMKSIIPGRTAMRVSDGVWCRTEKIMLQAVLDTTTMYYASTLCRHSVCLDHSECGDNHCVARQIDNSVYRTKHTLEGCQCAQISADTDAMRPILERGSIPCIEIIELGDEMELRVVASEASHYVAISHVWSDGLGNAKNNSLPLCQLRRLRSYINRGPQGQSECPLIWVDTLCVPLIRKDRNLALALLGKVYEQASIVLVLDAELLRISARQSSMEEKLLRICISGWMRRLWTLQEGVLGGSRTRFQFLDDAIELPSSMDSNHNTIGHRALELIHRYVPTRIQSFSKTQFKPTTNREGRSKTAIMALLIALQYRTTSRLTDETICVAPLLGEDTSTIVAFSTAEDRMIGLLGLLQQSNVIMPPHILFCGGEKLQRENFRWSPLSFTRMGTVDAQWSLESLQKGGEAQISSEGLVSQFGGLKFDVLGPFEGSFVIHVDGKWGKIMPRRLQEPRRQEGPGSNKGWEETRESQTCFLGSLWSFPLNTICLECSSLFYITSPPTQGKA